MTAQVFQKLKWCTMMHRFLFAIILLSKFSVFGQDPIRTKLVEWVKTQKQEKVYLHLDKPYFGIGETIWFKAYITEGTFHYPTPLSSNLYVELIDTKRNLVDSLVLPIIDGTSNGSFILKSDLTPGSYRIRAYTNWMRNFDEEFFFNRDISVIQPLAIEDTTRPKSPSRSENWYVDFMPEGGDLVDGISSKVAIKVTDSLGRGKLFSGTIQDEKGNQITSFESNRMGHALCFFQPSFDKKYYALIDNIKYQLPEVKKGGAVIRATHNQRSPILSISVLSNGIDLKGGKLIGHQRGHHLFTIECKTENQFFTKLKKKQLETGIIHLTFFDKHNLPVTERLIFPNIPSSDAMVSSKFDKDFYAKRERVLIEIGAEDSVHSASLTINHRDEVSYNYHGEDIQNYLLLTSDLKGRIEYPNHYFQKSTDEAYNDLDLLMLTQGWTRFNWDSLLAEKRFKPAFFQEHGLTIKGRLVKYSNNELLREGITSMTVPSIGILSREEKTDSLGNFEFRGIEFYDSTLLILKAYSFKGKKSKIDENVSIKLTPPNRPEVTRPIVPSEKVSDPFEEKMEKLDQIVKAYMLDQDAQLLDEVVVSVEDPREKEIQQRTLYREPTHRLFMDSINFTPFSIFDLLVRFPGVRVFGTYPFQEVVLNRSIGQAGGVAYVLNGMIVDNTVLQTIPPQNVDFIDVLNGPQATIYGARGYGGVVLVYTRKGGPIIEDVDTEPKGILAYMHPGYHKAKEFFSPRYDTPKEEHAIPDYRSTLFWEPNLKFEDGKAQVKLYTSDQSGIYNVRIEGILKDGTPFIEETLLSVE